MADNGRTPRKAPGAYDPGKFARKPSGTSKDPRISKGQTDKPTVASTRSRPDSETKCFTPVKKNSQIVRETQQRQYEQQKKEKLIFAFFVVIILVMILFAILIFRKVLDAPKETEPGTDTLISDTEAPTDSGTETEAPSSLFTTVMAPKGDLNSGNLILINSQNPYHTPKTAPVLVCVDDKSQTHFPKSTVARGYVYSYYITAAESVYLESETLAALNAMADALYTEKVTNDLYIKSGSSYIRDAGNEHATGTAVDLSVLIGYGNNSEYFSLGDKESAHVANWLLANYYKYGFILRYPAEKSEITGVSNDPYHFRYVGIPHAYYMFKQGLVLEEYLTMLRTEHSAEAGKTNALVFTAEDGCRYEVYYVAASAGDMTEIPVPNYAVSCSISGDNMDGFIVTVRAN